MPALSLVACLTVIFSIVDLWQCCVCCTRSGVTRRPILWRSTCALFASPGYTRCFDRTSVYFCSSPLKNLAVLLFLSQSLSGMIWLTAYLMVWDWRVSRAGPMPFYWPSCSLLFCLRLFFLSFLFLYMLVVWGWGLRTDRVSISLSRPCISNLF